MFLNNSLLFNEISKNLDLKDILNLRLVSSSFKSMSDDYLKNQKSLSIYIGEFDDDRYLNEINLLKSNYKFEHRFLIRKKSSTKLIQFIKKLTKLFPNIEELCLLEGKLKEKSFSSALISKWKNLKKFFSAMSYITGIRTFSDNSYFKIFNCLKSLETLVIYVDQIDILSYHSALSRKNGCNFKNSPFLNRIKHLFLPSIEWLKDVTKCPNLVSLGFHRIPEEAPKFWFARIQNLYILFCWDDMFDPLLDFVKKLSSVNSQNLVSFGFNHFVSFSFYSFCFLLLIISKF